MLETYSKEEIKEISMLDIALAIFREKKKPIPFTDLMDQVAKIRYMSKEEQKRRIAQFYTDINIDGRFVCIGDNQWGLKSWYPVESSEEELATTIKPKRKKAKAKLEDEDDFEDYDDDVDEDFDDLDEEDIDETEDDEDFTDFADVDEEDDTEDDDDDEADEEYEDKYDLEDEDTDKD